MNERPPNRDELRDREQLLQEGIECLGFIVALPSNLDDSAAVFRAVRQFVDEVRQGTPLPRAYRDLEQAAYALGTLWGDEICRAFKWDLELLNILLGRPAAIFSRQSQGTGVWELLG